MINWRTEKRKISELKPFPGNPRKANDKEWKDLNKSLDRFNVASPLIINTDNTVIGGNFRLKVLKEKGVDEVDVRVPDRPLNRKEAEELNVRLNKNTGQWDYDLLANFDEDLLVDSGFEEQELEKKFLSDTLDTFPDEDVDFGYKFGTINAWVRIGDLHGEIEDSDYQKIKGIINSAGGIKGFIKKVIDENKNETK